MIYLANILLPQEVNIPVVTDTEVGEVSLRLICNTSNEVAVDVEVTDLDIYRDYHTIGVELPEGLPSGEYDYYLLSDGAVLSSGLLQIGDYHRPEDVYNEDDNNELIQYDGE